jgi:iron complex outermembrane receptor protein
MKFKRTILSTVVSLCFMVPASYAQSVDENSIEHVLVTADFRDQQLLDFATSVSVFDQNVIERRNAQHLEQLLNLAPNTNLTAGASRGRFFQIRGIGERSQFIDPVNPSVGLIIDGIDFTGLGLAASTLDVQQVEVFRGPQGTLYGANALAGLINIKSNDPTEALSLKINADVSNYNGHTFGAVVSGPATDNISYRLAAQKQESDGFTDNVFLNRKDTNDIDESVVRGKLRFHASDDLTIDFTGLYLDADNGYDAFSLTNNRVTGSDQPGVDTQKSRAVAISVDWNASNAFDLQANFSAANNDLGYSFDEDWSNVNEFAPELGPYSSADSYIRDRNNVTADLRLISSEGGNIFGDTTQWVLGFYNRIEDEDLERNRFSDLLPDGTFSNVYDTKNQAVYGQLDSQLNSQWTLVTGLRVERRDADYADSFGVNRDVVETNWGGRVVIEFKPQDTATLYASVSRGYKNSGVNGQIISAAELNQSIPQDTFFFDTETLINYEFGIKGRSVDNKLQLQFAIFYQDRHDAQVGQSVFNASDFSFDEYLDNADASSKGLEAELSYSVTENFQFYASFGLLDATFGNFSSLSHADARTLQSVISLKGREIAQAPQYQFALGTDFNITENFKFNFELEGKDNYFFSNSHNDKSDSYVLANMSLGYQIENWELTIWGRNLTDEDVQTRGFFFSNESGNNPAKSYAPEPYYQFGEPRVYGFSLGYEF